MLIIVCRHGGCLTDADLMQAVGISMPLDTYSIEFAKCSQTSGE